MNTSSGMGSMIKLGGNLEDPRASKPSDWPDVGPTGSAGMESGAMKLVKQSMEQEGPMHTQDSGDMTPSVWGKADFPVGKSKGEGGMMSTSVKWDCAVDFKSGQTVPNAMDDKY